MKETKPIRFYKVQGAGNDMIVFHQSDLGKISEKKKGSFVAKLAHRQLGVGADQVMEIITLSPLHIQIWNQDGSKAEMCANGARTFLHLARERGWIDPELEKVPLKVSSGQYFANKVKKGYELSLGIPKMSALKSLKINNHIIPYRAVNVGNPHAVIFTTGKKFDPWLAPFEFKVLGPQVECHKDFPHKTNVEFVRTWKKKGNVIWATVDVWERGSGATLSCGSGAVAVASTFNQMMGAKAVYINMNGFELTVRFKAREAFLSGPSALVACGELIGLSE